MKEEEEEAAVAAGLWCAVAGRWVCPACLRPFACAGALADRIEAAHPDAAAGGGGVAGGGAGTGWRAWRSA